MPRVSVVIPNYNGEKYLRGCLESLSLQDDLDFETIIIDNASQDSDYKWIEEAYPDIIFKQLDKNYGFSPAVNVGIKMAQGEYVLLLNNDTVVEQDFISQMVKAIEKDERIFGVSSKMIAYHNHAIMDDAGDEYTILGWAYKRGDGKPVEQFNEGKKVFSACAGAALYRKKVFEEMGLFDEDFFAYMEDVDVSYRARIYGYYNVYCPEAKVYHIGSATSGSKYNAFKVRLAARNNVYVPYKNMPLLQLIVNLPALVVGTLVKGLWFLKKGFGKEYRAGLWEGVKSLHKIKKVPYQGKHLKHYLHIEWLLIQNTFKYIVSKIKK
ncbi:MAG: glycosyltransferase family 2 protein [Cellulosilyticum sp.]|nr:glycosyltransferase family 2 protein [Cellulosilyticum sp.]